MRTIQQREEVVIRFAGDSGDGMQVTGSEFTNTTALQGNDLATFPDFPAEIRAPAGTRPGVSGFQLHFSSKDIHTPGDAPEVLVAMNPAALVTNIKDLKKGGMVIVNVDKFTERDLEKADCKTNPLEDGSLAEYKVVPVAMGVLAKQAVEGLGLGAKEVDRCKNFFALGMMYWLYHRDVSYTRKWVESKFKDPYKTANLKSMEAGWSYAETLELFQESYEVPPAKVSPGVYRNITGTQALALGFVTAAQLAKRPLFQGAYPITPASDLLHTLATYRAFDVTTFQAEDEIAAIAATIGAAYGGSIALTSTSGPGLALKGEALGLAVMTELPIVVVDIQRGGPSTGLPTKTEQSDLLQAMYGRHGEAPVPILACATPGDCFDTAIEAVRIATTYMTPVILLSDGYITNGSEPWRLPDLEKLEPIVPPFRTDPVGFTPYKRDPDTLARPWAIPGTPGLEHRIGGIEKQDVTGNISYDPLNHEHMSRTRAARVKGIQKVIAPAKPWGDSEGLLVLSWGGTFGATRTACEETRESGLKVGHLHLRWLNPFPANLGDVLRQYQRVLVPELNLGQLVKLIRAEFLVDAISYTKIQGLPFRSSELVERIHAIAARGEA